jgi:hypothetical protein
MSGPGLGTAVLVALVLGFMLGAVTSGAGRAVTDWFEQRAKTRRFRRATWPALGRAGLWWMVLLAGAAILIVR